MEIKEDMLFGAFILLFLGIILALFFTHDDLYNQMLYLCIVIIFPLILALFLIIKVIKIPANQLVEKFNQLSLRVRILMIAIILLVLSEFIIPENWIRRVNFICCILYVIFFYEFFFRRNNS